MVSKIPAAFLILLAFTLAPFTSGSPLEPRRYPRPPFERQPFNILIRPADLSGPDIYEDYVYLTPQYDSKSQTYHTRAYHGGAPTTFVIRKGFLMAAVNYDNSTTGASESSVWRNMRLINNTYASWRPISESPVPEKRGHVHIDVGTNAFVQPGKNHWSFCNAADGTKLGLAVGEVDHPGVTCTYVYAFATNQSD